MENVGLLRNGAGDLVTEAMEKGEMLNVIFASVFSSKTCLQESQVLETRGKVWSKEDFSLVEEDQARQCLNELAIHKSLGPVGKLLEASAEGTGQ